MQKASQGKECVLQEREATECRREKERGNWNVTKENEKDIKLSKANAQQPTTTTMSVQAAADGLTNHRVSKENKRGAKRERESVCRPTRRI